MGHIMWHSFTSGLHNIGDKEKMQSTALRFQSHRCIGFYGCIGAALQLQQLLLSDDTQLEVSDASESLSNVVEVVQQEADPT